MIHVRAIADSRARPNPFDQLARRFGNYYSIIRRGHFKAILRHRNYHRNPSIARSCCGQIEGNCGLLTVNRLLRDSRLRPTCLPPRLTTCRQCSIPMVQDTKDGTEQIETMSWSLEKPGSCDEQHFSHHSEYIFSVELSVR